MRQVTLVAALACAVMAPDDVRAQDWGGAAGVAASRGYTASPGLSTTSPIGAAAPADAEALAAPSGVPAPGVPVMGLTGGVARHAGHKVGGAVHVRAKRGIGRRHSRIA